MRAWALGWLVGPALGGTHTYVPHRFRQDFGGFFRHKDMAGKPVVSRVLSDKPKVPVGGQQSVWAGWGLRPPRHMRGPLSCHNGSRPSPHLGLCSSPLTCCSLDGIHRKRCFLTGKSGYIYSPTGGRVEEGGHQPAGGRGGRAGMGPGGSPWPPGSHQP